MSTILDTTLLGHFSYLFTFLLILVIVFAILEYKKILGTSTGINALIALTIAVIFTASKGAVAVISVAAPWFIIVFFFIFLMLMGFTIFGAESSDFLSMIKSKEHNYIVTVVVIILLIVIALSLGTVYGQGLLSKTKEGAPKEVPVPVGEQIEGVDFNTGETGTPSYSQNLYATLFHPKVVGLVMVLLIATFTIKYLSGKTT